MINVYLKTTRWVWVCRKMGKILCIRSLCVVWSIRPEGKIESKDRLGKKMWFELDPSFWELLNQKRWEGFVVRLRLSFFPLSDLPPCLMHHSCTLFFYLLFGESCSQEEEEVPVNLWLTEVRTMFYWSLMIDRDTYSLYLDWVVYSLWVFSRGILLLKQYWFGKSIQLGLLEK